MNHNVTLTVSSLLAILFFLFHIADDIVRGFEKGGLWNLMTVPIAVFWLYGTLVLAGRKSGYIIMLIMSLLASGIPYLHMRGSGLVAGRIAGSSGVFFWVFTVLALGVCAFFSFVLAAYSLWQLRRSQSR